MPKIGIDSNKPTTWKNRLEEAINRNSELRRTLLVEGIFIACFSASEQKDLLTKFLNKYSHNFYQRFFTVIGSNKSEFKDFFINSLRETILALAKGSELSAFHESIINEIVAIREKYGLETDRNCFTSGFAIIKYSQFLKEELYNDRDHQDLDDDDIVDHLNKTVPNKRSFLASRDNRNIIAANSLATMLLLLKDNKNIIFYLLLFLLLLLAAHAMSKKWQGSNIFANHGREIIDSLFRTKMDFLEEQFVVEAESYEEKNPRPTPYPVEFLPTVKAEDKTNAPAQAITEISTAALPTDSPLNTSKKKKYEEQPQQTPKNSVVVKLKFIDIIKLEPPSHPAWRGAKCFRMIGGNKFCFGLLDETVNRYSIKTQIIEGFARGFNSKHAPGVVWDHGIYKVIPTGSTADRVTASEIRTCLVDGKTYELHVFKTLIDTHTRTPKPPDEFTDVYISPNAVARP